jgi:hypothetical protein
MMDAGARIRPWRQPPMTATSAVQAECARKTGGKQEDNRKRTGAMTCSFSKETLAKC